MMGMGRKDEVAGKKGNAGNEGPARMAGSQLCVTGRAEIRQPFSSFIFHLSSFISSSIIPFFICV